MPLPKSDKDEKQQGVYAPDNEDVPEALRRPAETRDGFTPFYQQEARKPEQKKEQPTEESEPENPYKAEMDAAGGEYLASLASLLERPLDQAERERRERGLHARSAIGHLGNVMSAFGNLWGTSKGAPAQQLPAPPDAGAAVKDLRADQQRLADRYMEGAGKKFAYAKARYDAEEARRAAAMKAQRDALDLQSNLLLRASQAGKNNAEAAALGPKTQSEITRNYAQADKYKQEGDMVAPLARSLMGLRGSQAGLNNARAQSVTDGSRVTLTTRQGTYHIPKSAWNPTNIGRLIDAYVSSVQGSEAKKAAARRDAETVRLAVQTLGSEVAGETERMRSQKQIETWLGQRLDDKENSAVRAILAQLAAGGAETMPGL